MNGSTPAFAKPPLRDERLPPIPPSDHDDAGFAPPPPPPTKSGTSLPPIDTFASLSVPGFDPNQPMTPMTPTGQHPPRSPAADGKPKKVNPLTDLVETEKVYVDLLTGVIRKVAAAWSRSNLPPPELDSMFRSIEGVYRANRSLLSKLKEIGSNPSSPKALGDLLMRWIDDLETPYTTYSVKYHAGFDDWDPVRSNPRLRTTLAIFSSSNPPPIPPSSDPHPAVPPLWTLDDLFLLPKDRLKYYRKLYSRLLKSTTPGRSDHRLLAGALDKLDNLLSTLEQRAILHVGRSAPPQDLLPPTTEDEVVIDLRSRDSNGHALKGNFIPVVPPQRESDSTAGSGSFTSGGRLSQDTTPTSEERGPTSPMSMSMTDLENRVSTERTLDIFTMKPKQVRLQICPPTLTYTRELRISADVVLSLVPRSTGVEVVQERGHVFILTDLLLICERMTREESSRSGPGGPDMWLLYPPLAGKHLRVALLEGSNTAFTVTILKKETLVIHADSLHQRDTLMKEFTECIETGASVTPSKNAPLPPPVPALPPVMPGSSGHLPRESRAPGRSASMSPPVRVMSPGRGPSQVSILDNRVLSPPPNGIGLPVNFPPRSSSAAPGMSGMGPGQVMPGAGFGPGPAMSPSFGPGQIIPPPSQSPLALGAMPSEGAIVGPPRGTSRAVTPGAQGEPIRTPGPMGGPIGLPPRAGAPFAGPGMHTGGPPPLGPPHHPQQPFGGPMYGGPPGSRPPSDGSYGGSLRKSPSSRSMASQYDQMSFNNQPPMPAYPDGLPPPRIPFARSGSSGSLNSLHAPKPLLPSAQASLRSVSTAGSFVEPSPPNSPVEETAQHTGPTSQTVAAQMKCKIFLKQQHAQWKNLGTAKLVLYRESPTNIKQLVVEADNSKKTMMISTIVLPDGVERVGKTGVAIELSDKGQRTGVVYMIQLRNETSAGGLFDTLLAGSDRSAVKS